MGWLKRPWYSSPMWHVKELFKLASLGVSAEAGPPVDQGVCLKAKKGHLAAYTAFPHFSWSQWVLLSAAVVRSVLNVPLMLPSWKSRVVNLATNLLQHTSTGHTPTSILVPLPQLLDQHIVGFSFQKQSMESSVGLWALQCGHGGSSCTIGQDCVWSQVGRGVCNVGWRVHFPVPGYCWWGLGLLFPPNDVNCGKWRLTVVS